MRDKLPLITMAGMVLLFVIVLTTVVLVENSTSQASLNKISGQISTVQKKVDDITAAKDTNNFTPTEAVTFFLTAVKADNTDLAKLYLSSKVQDMDIKNTLKLGTDLTDLTIGDSDQSIDGDNAVVKINLQIGTDQVARDFAIAKEEGAWKITGITAE